MITALSASHRDSVSTQACNQLKPTLASLISVVAQLENTASKTASGAVTVQYDASSKTVTYPFAGVIGVRENRKCLLSTILQVRFRPSPPVPEAGLHQELRKLARCKLSLESPPFWPGGQKLRNIREKGAHNSFTRRETINVGLKPSTCAIDCSAEERLIPSLRQRIKRAIESQNF
jgi:hypothetical protein